MSPSTGTARPGGRSGRVVAAIYTSVGELVGEGCDKITFPVIAERAGVAPTTLYRRWADVADLLEEVTAAALTRQGESAPDTGSVEGDLTQWAIAITHDIGRPERARYLRAMVSSRTDLVLSCPVSDKRREQAAEVVRRARERGETSPTVRQILDHIVAPLYYRVVFALGVAEDDARELVGDVLAMID